MFNLESQTWKTALTPGDEIDYLQKDMDFNFNIDRIGVAHWTRAKIKEIDQNKTIKIKVIGTGEVLIVSLLSSHILPARTLSKDFEWRESLKKGDEIDFLDSKSWYRSTIIDATEKFKGLNNSYKYVKYGLRIYRDNGRNKSNQGKTFFGWSENFDKETSVHDPRIRMPNHFSKTIENIELISSYPNDCKKFNDLETYIPVFIIIKKFSLKLMGINFILFLENLTILKN